MDVYFKSHKHKECLTHMFSIVYFITFLVMHLAKHSFRFQVHHWSILQISAYPPKVEKLIPSYWHTFCVGSISYTETKLYLGLILHYHCWWSCISTPVKPPAGTWLPFFSFSIKYLVINTSSKNMAMIWDSMEDIKRRIPHM